MTEDVEVIAPTDTIFDASRKMRDLGVGSLPVCDGERLVGMITDRDITVRVTAREGIPSRIIVRECMTPRVFYCFEDETDLDAERIMAEKQVRRLPVIDREKRLVGIVSLSDLVRCENRPAIMPMRVLKAAA